jgi:hypothetical protein
MNSKSVLCLSYQNTTGEGTILCFKLLAWDGNTDKNLVWLVFFAHRYISSTIKVSEA